MSELFKARNLMKKKFIKVPEDTKTYDAIQIMLDHEALSLPVLNKKGELVGIITERDMLKLLYDPYQKCEWVKDVMNTKPAAFDEETSIIELCDFFINNPIKSVPIIKEKKVIGMAHSEDVIKFIMKIHKGKIKF